LGWVNPYKPPSARLGGKEQALNSRRPGYLWKLLFWVWLLAQLYSWYGVLDSLNAGIEIHWTWLLADTFIYPVVLLGLYGFAYQKRLFRQTFWKIFFPIFLLVDVSLFVWTMMDAQQDSLTSLWERGRLIDYQYLSGMDWLWMIAAIAAAVFAVFTAILIELFTYYALYLYGYRNGYGVWNRDETKVDP
jgi:hypothetical protein